MNWKLKYNHDENVKIYILSTTAFPSFKNEQNHVNIPQIRDIFYIYIYIYIY